MKTFDDDDLLGRKTFAKQLTKLVKTSTAAHEEAFVLSLNAKFGSGKTYFLKLWKNYLDTTNKGEFQTIYINAWESDYANDPIIPIIAALTKMADNRESGNDFSEIFVNVCYQLVEKHTGIDVKKTLIESKKHNEIGKALLKDFNEQASLRSDMRKALENYVKQLECKKLIIIIDELDRARPDYSVNFLEAIKHIFSVEGICFILAVDRDKIEKSVKCLFGDIDFGSYYRRFVAQENDLPEPAFEEYRRFCDSLLGNFENDSSARIGTPFSRIAYTFGLTPREIEEASRRFMQIMPNNSTDNLSLAAAFLIAVSIRSSEDLYHQIGKGVIDIKKLYENAQHYFDKLTKYEKGRRDIYSDLLNVMFFYIDWGKDKEVTELADIRGSTSDDIHKLANHRLGSIFTRQEGRVFSEIYEKLQNLESF